MANPSLLISLSFCFLLILQGSLADDVNVSYSRSRSRSRSQESFRQRNECQFDRLQALEPDNRIQAEAGVIESWNPNHDQFQCAGVAVTRSTIEPNGLHLPSYTNTPQLIYIVKGRAITGTIFPGCPETFEESQREQGQGRSQGSRKDRHQRLHHLREGDILAIPAGVAYWCYNNGDQQLVSVSLLDTSNFNNQLDDNPRRFYLAGNPEDEFEQLRREGGRGREREGRQAWRGGQGSSEDYNNIFRGFNSRLLEEAFNVDQETVRRLQGQSDNRNSIIRVKGRLDLVSPLRSRQEGQREGRWEEEREREREEEQRRMRRGGGYDANGLEETFCSLRLRENIGDPSRADVFTPQAGRVSTVNSFNLPILGHLQLSAERGTLYRSAIYTPHWNVNAHSVIYVLRGRARIQVVDHLGQSFFDGEVRQGQILTVPQNHAVVKQAGSEGFEWVSFKTNDNAWISPLAGRTSVIRALPEAVLANAFQISRDQARRLKYNREETFLLTSSSSRREDESERRAAA
ncbi:11-S seed storage protein [Parasponia andersonii]|uniref:11S seed storage protein n=1 Tax=Parasponia andersonii TaxID=3476 RepID=A0A2P5CNM9_PARAD|nr:11-S seed storage protein [Parasponia andersonii]